MRVRDERLRSGRLLAWFDSQDRRRNAALLFLARGADDIEPLTRIEEAYQRIVETGDIGGVERHVVADAGQLASVDSALSPSQVSRIEAAELAMLSVKDLRTLLEPALIRLASGERQLFPAAGGAVGSPAEGIQFLGRAQEIREALARLAAGNHLEILAPRRSGKSSFMRRLAEELPEGWHGIFVNLEKEFTPEDFAARLWVEAAGGPYREAQRQAEKGWEALLAEAVRRLGEGPEVLVLLLDELVFFLQNQSSAEAEVSRVALAILGSLEVALEGSPIRIVTASSLPLGEYLHEMLGLPRSRLPRLFRSLNPIRLPRLDFHAPDLELRRVLLGTGLVPEGSDVEWLNENVDLALPYPALRFLDFLASHLRVRGSADEAKLDRLLEQFLDATDAFDEFESNLRRRGGQHTGGLRALRSCLDCLAAAEPRAVVSHEEVRRCLETAARPGELLAWLVETFPVDEGPEGVALASVLFRRWWRRQLADGGAEA